MTEEQWDFLNAELSALKVAVFALAETVNNASLRDAFMRARETAETAWLHTALSERSLEEKRRKLDGLASVIFGEAEPPPSPRQTRP